MTDTTEPRRKLIIKLYSSRSETRELPHYHSGYSPVAESSEIQRIIAEDNLRANATDSSIVSKVCALKNKKGCYAAATWVNVENPTNSSGAADSISSRTENASKSYGADSRISDTGNPSKFSGAADSRKSRRGSKECKLNSKRERKMHHPMMMDSSRKKQCWAMLKRLMVGRDVWALKQPLLHYNSQAMRKPKLKALEDIESKLMNLGYYEVDEFSHDVRLVFSYALGYPPRGEVHKTARRISEDFEVSWQKLREEWMHEEKEKKEEDLT